jgi:Asp-tRNA(Asn)/Glu-tRNA(Gln) amidotransferase A subunit family amidase
VNFGNPVNVGHIAAANSEAVVRLLRAGCVLLGKTNLALDLNDVQSYNEVYWTLEPNAARLQ